jgi:hypothetical protein
LDRYPGWWNGVVSGDLDGDGRFDLVATGWGRNHKYAAFQKDGLRLYYGDVDGNGVVEIIEAYRDPESGKVVPWRDWGPVTEAIPWLRERWTTYRAFGQASVAELFGERFSQLRELTANTLETVVFWNRGDRFEPQPLPVEAQLSPAFGVCVGDADGDGSEDLFLAQNFFGVEPDSARHDAGRGLWLQGNGRGGFRPLPGWESGVKVYGEQRGCALADFDRDRRVDLVLAQNHGRTKLYRNRLARPGLRVRLNAGLANPTGVGAAVRLVFEDRIGPVREVRAGSGYWSQDGAVLVLAAPAPPRELWVRWPGGKTVTYALPAGALEITAFVDGRLDSP